MQEFFSNNWTIGIIGGIISGIIVYIITDRIFSKRENKEYIQKLKIANNELLYNIRPLIVEENKPTIEILNSIIRATARKYSVKIEDLYSKDDISDELIKEIIANPFLTSDNKLQYSNLCLEISKLTEEEKTSPEHKIVYINRNKDISKETLTLTLGLVTALTSTLFIKIFKTDFIEDIKYEEIISVLPIIIIIPILSLVLSRILQILKKEKERKLQSENMDDFIINIKNKLNKDSHDK